MQTLQKNKSLKLLKNLEVEYMSGKDVLQVCEIDKINHTSYDEDFEINVTSRLCWDIHKFNKCFRQDKVVGRCVKDEEGNVISFVLFKLFKDSFQILKFETDKRLAEYNKAQIMILDALKSKLAKQNRIRITYAVPDTDLEMHLLLKDNNFTAKKVKRNHFEEVNADAYVFVYELAKSEDVEEEI